MIPHPTDLQAAAHDFGRAHLGVAKSDLVTEKYLPNPVARAGKIKAALRFGGLFVLEFFLDEGDGGVKPAELRAQFADGFDVLRNEVVEDHPDWARTAKSSCGSSRASAASKPGRA
jgi:hypothetical protein